MGLLIAVSLALWASASKEIETTPVAAPDIGEMPTRAVVVNPETKAVELEGAE